MKKGQVSKALLGLEILLCCCLPMFLTGVTVAATPQITQVNSRTINRPTLKVGSQGEPVSEIQAALKLLGFYTGAVDGVYNNMTASAVSKFKQAVGLNPDGIVDASTWQQLFPGDSTVASSVSPPNSANKFPAPSQTSNSNQAGTPSPEPRPAARTHTTSSKVVNSTNPEPRPTTPNTTSSKVVNSNNLEPKPATPNNTSSNAQKAPVRQSSPTHTQQTARTQQDSVIQYTSEGWPILRAGMHGLEVAKLQQRLHKLGFFKGSIDGDFGADTVVAVKAAQKRYGLEADGVVGGGTWEVLQRRR